MSPEKLIKTLNSKMPSVWKTIEGMRSERGKRLPYWPNWCFFPISGSLSIWWMDDNQSKLRDFVSAGGLTALIGWNYTKGIYKFNPELFEEIKNTKITGNIPTDVLYRLPEWCCYIDTPSLEIHGGMAYINGFFVYLEYDINTKRSELRFWYEIIYKQESANKKNLGTDSIVHIGDWDVEEGVNKSIIESIRVLDQMGVDANEQIKKLLSGYGESEDFLDKDIISDSTLLTTETVKQLLPFVLYICSNEPDIKKINNTLPKRPKPISIHGAKKRIIAPKQVKTWLVGEKVGADLSKLKKEKEEYSQSQNSEAHRTVSPHIRRAHWHGYYKNDEAGEKVFFYKWLPPILVRGIL